MRIPCLENRSRKSSVRSLAASSFSTVRLTLSRSTIQGAFWPHFTYSPTTMRETGRVVPFESS